jgi:hypothetical protein
MMTHQVSQTSEKAEAELEIRPQALIYCPVTGEQAKKLAENYIVMSYGQAIWWHCSACRGWHIALENRHS